jgi:hypothetical protein
MVGRDAFAWCYRHTDMATLLRAMSEPRKVLEAALDDDRKQTFPETIPVHGQQKTLHHISSTGTRVYFTRPERLELPTF